jgi:hypothetical protein
MKWDKSISNEELYDFMSTRPVKEGISSQSTLHNNFTFFLVSKYPVPLTHIFMSDSFSIPKPIAFTFLVIPSSLSKYNFKTLRTNVPFDSPISSPMYKEYTLCGAGLFTVDERTIKPTEATTHDYIQYLKLCKIQKQIQTELIKWRNK